MDEKTEFSILIIEDENASIDDLRYILSPNYMLHIAKTGEAALDIAHKDKPDLILLDILLPDMSGFDVLTAIKSSYSLSETPVIVITGLNSAHDEEKSLQLGAVDFVTKPYHASIVKARVNTHLNIVRHIRTIERFGLIDALTDIPNRRCFESQFAVEWGRAAREQNSLCLLMIDVDNFKTYNDAYGHHGGDVLLKDIVRVFLSVIKRTTDLIFRWAGDEFAVLLPNTDYEGGCLVAESIRAGVEAKFAAGKSVSVTVSIGVAAMIPAAEDKAGDLFNRADNALYQAKESGKNRYCGDDT